VIPNSSKMLAGRLTTAAVCLSIFNTINMNIVYSINGIHCMEIMKAERFSAFFYITQ